MSYAVEIQNLSKRFRLYQEKYSSLKERVVHAGHIPYDDFWALKDVEASFEAGQTIGMLGRNGSGKSTLLKCIAGILQPSSGQVVVRGKVAAMLELGAGFSHDLSGRDNVYLNGTLLGMSRKEIRRRFDEIVAFAELEQFIDNQVKYYSSGMIVRLGFAVAISIEPDVLLVDEVLAVGDERFQQKCLERVGQLQQEGRTIVVVSHAPDMMRELCDVILVLDHGNVVAFGKPGEAIRAFREGLLETPGLAGAEAGAAAESPPGRDHRGVGRLPRCRGATLRDHGRTPHRARRLPRTFGRRCRAVRDRNLLGRERTDLPQPDRSRGFHDARAGRGLGVVPLRRDAAFGWAVHRQFLAAQRRRRRPCHRRTGVCLRSDEPGSVARCRRPADASRAHGARGDAQPSRDLSFVRHRRVERADRRRVPPRRRLTRR